MKKRVKRIPLKPLKITAIERKLFTKIARKIADTAVNKSFTKHESQIVACCDFLIQEINEGRI